MERTVYDQAFKAKLENLEQKGELTHFIYDRMVFQKIKDILGGEIKLIISGGAPLSKEVKDFFMVVFCVPVEEVYGVTECGGGVTATSVWDRSTGNVGGPLCVAKIKLKDLPDLGYLTTDEPYPRGEVCIKGNCVFKGYFRNKELTN
jgi:long-chain acyl-CoA synthetase